MSNQEAIFGAKATQRLPLYIEYDGVIYKLAAQMLMGGGFRITYGWFNGTAFDWNQPKLYDKIYNNDETDDDVITDAIRNVGSKGNHLSEVEANHRFRTKYVAPVKVDVIAPAPKQPVTLTALRKELMARRTSLIAMMKIEKDHDIKCELFGRKQELGAVNDGFDKTVSKAAVQNINKALIIAQTENVRLQKLVNTMTTTVTKQRERVNEINTLAADILSITRQ